jgi:hypothetical protein
MTWPEEYGYYAIAERSYKECAKKNTVVHANRKNNPGAYWNPGGL